MIDSSPVSWTQTVGSFLLPSCLGRCALATIPPVGSFSRMQPWESNVLLRPSGLCSDWTPLRPPHKTKILADDYEVLLALQPLKTTLVCSPLACYTCHLPIWSGLPLSSISPRPSYIGACFRFHSGNSWGCEPTVTNTQTTAKSKYFLCRNIFLRINFNVPQVTIS